MGNTTYLLASHGSEGAKAAELLAIQNCSPGSSIHHLLVVPDFWYGMTGDDWLNNGSTRDTFRRYLETELGKEVDEHISRVSQLCESHGIDYRNSISYGEPEYCLLSLAERYPFKGIFVGSKRPKSVPGLRSRMVTNTVLKKLHIPLITAPYPNEH